MSGPPTRRDGVVDSRDSRQNFAGSFNKDLVVVVLANLGHFVARVFPACCLGAQTFADSESCGLPSGTR
jgi:hypothetical protein